MQLTVKHPDRGDVKVIPEELGDRYTGWGWEVIATTGSPADLKGAALDQALEDAGLSKSGTADEKRARLAEHQANAATE